MTYGHLGIIKDQGGPLAGLIEAGCGFRFRNREQEFTLVEETLSGWTFRDESGSLEVQVRLRRAADAFVISTRLVNIGSGPVREIHVLEPLHVVFSNPASRWRHIFANGGRAEFYYPPSAFRTQEWTYADRGLRIESHPQGRSSNLYLPLLVSLTSAAPDSDGLFCGMEWSGAWYIAVEPIDDARSSLSVGVEVRGIELSPGEVLDLPDVHLGFFGGGPAVGTNRLRRYLYEHVCPTYCGEQVLPRVSYDHYFGIYNRLNEQLLKLQATRAAEIGVEVFVVDASWFAGDFPYGVGNWYDVDRRKFPDGLESLADFVRSLGMYFGLWFEVERACDGTAILREHPEWFAKVPWHNEESHHLNLACREAQDHVIDLISGWIERLDVRWSRWDYNIEPMPFWQAVDPSLKIQFEYFKGLYRVLDELMRRHPKWMVEGCASGGRRIDIGTMRRAHTYWFSDQTYVAPICRFTQARANRFLPGHLLNSSVAVNLGNGDAGFDDTSILSRMLGKLAFDGDIAGWSPTLSARMARWVTQFKAVRHLFVQDFYQLLPQPSTIEDWDAVQFVSYTGDETAVMAFSGIHDGSTRLKLHGLDAEQTYRVARVPDGPEAIRRGAELMSDGLVVQLEAEAGAMWRINASDNPAMSNTVPD